MSLKPLNDRVLVKRLESEERTASGLYIPDTAKEKPSKGEVVAVGPGKHADDGKLVPMAVKVSSSTSMPALKSRSTAPSISSCVKTTSLPSLPKRPFCRLRPKTSFLFR